MDEALVIFIKNPDPGRCKTRLAQSIGDKKALEVYKSLLKHTKEVCLKSDADKFLFYDSYINPEDTWDNTQFSKRLQSGSDLGERMAGAFSEILQNYKRVVLIGSDCPEITSSHISEAFDSLDRCDVVIGPSKDGGYYLIGMKVMHEGLFDNITWSTETVLNDTVARINEEGLSYALLETLHDLDDLADLRLFPQFTSWNQSNS